MRLDKFLKVSRIFKRRVIAKEVAAKEKILINGRLAKPGTQVEPGDLLKITYGDNEFTVRVCDIATSAGKDKAASLYEVVEEKSRR